MRLGRGKVDIPWLQNDKQFLKLGSVQEPCE